MENFVLYEEVGKSEHCIVYKGRRKGTIQFVAIHCVDKCKRPEVTNLVRLTHEIDHINVVKFYEWYETSNHLWLVVELCTGGSLETVVIQDEHLPESSIRKFGIDMVQGLHHIHSLGIVFSDLKPSKLLLDGPGVLKYADFGLSRVEGEDLAELFQQFIDAGEAWTTEGAGEEEGENTAVSETKKYHTTGCPTYIAPEVLDGTGEYTISSDLWSLGCIFYEMYTGRPPFEADSLEQLIEKVVHEELPLPRVKGSRVTGKPSPEFQNLLTKLLAKNMNERLGWAGLVKHSFWQGGLEHLVKELDVTPDIRESMRQSIANFSTRASSVSELPKTNSVLGQIHGVHLKDPPDSVQDQAGISLAGGDVPGVGEHPAERPDSSVGFRPRTSPAVGDAQVAFTLSSRPHTAVTPDPTTDEHLSAVSPQKLLTQSPVPVKSSIWQAKQQLGEQSEILHLVYHTSDFTVSSIVDNPKIQKLVQLKYDSKALPVQAYSVEKLLSMSQADLDKHIAALIENIGTPERGPISQRRAQLLNYVATIGSNGHLANALVAAGTLNALAVQVKDAPLLEPRHKLCRVIGIIANNTRELSEANNVAEVASILTEVLRDNFRMSKMKVAILPALGEVLYLVASQEEVKGEPKENWAIPQMTYTLTIRCLREGEEAVVNHYAAKIVENVATTVGQHSQKLAVNEVGLLLWYAFTHATADALRITALSALCRLTKHSISIFQNVIDKVGLPKMLTTMALPISRIQQAVITMFASLITADVRLTRLIQDKDFMHQLMRLLESPSVVIRGKAFLVIVEVIHNQQEMLLVCCQNRLVMYVERDSRRQAPGKAENQSQMDYLSRCLEFLISRLVDLVPKIAKEILSTLDAVAGRKHPSTVQVKQLKMCLPMMPVLQHLTSSQVFRPHLVNDSFLIDIGRFVSHLKAIDSGTTQIQAATGMLGSEEFLHTVCALVEIIAKHPAILMEHRDLVIDEILPPLAQLVPSSFVDTRALSLRLFSEIASVYLNQGQFEPEYQKVASKPLDEIITQILLPQFEQILLEQDPLPSYALKLLQAYLDNNPTFIKEFEKLGLVPVVFQVLMDHQNNPVSHTMQQIVGVIGSLVSHRETNMQELYEQGLVTHCTSLFMEVTAMNTDDNADVKSSVTMLQTLLDVLHTVLKYVSDVVKKALQAKKTGGEGGTKAAEQAEALLLVNKQFTDLTSFLTPLLVHEDNDIADISLKCLSLLVQLFGGEHADAMTKENMECYSEALSRADPKKQKVILRIIKRMLSTEKIHCDMMKKHGGHLAKTIKSLVEAASSNAEVALTSLAADILKATGYLPA